MYVPYTEFLETLSKDNTCKFIYDLKKITLKINEFLCNRRALFQMSSVSTGSKGMRKKFVYNCVGPEN